MSDTSRSSGPATSSAAVAGRPGRAGSVSPAPSSTRRGCRRHVRGLPALRRRADDRDLNEKLPRRHRLHRAMLLAFPIDDDLVLPGGRRRPDQGDGAGPGSPPGGDRRPADVARRRRGSARWSRQVAGARARVRRPTTSSRSSSCTAVLLHLLNYDHAEPRLQEAADAATAKQELTLAAGATRREAPSVRTRTSPGRGRVVSGGDWVRSSRCVVCAVRSISDRPGDGRDGVHAHEPHPRAVARGRGQEAGDPTGSRSMLETPGAARSTWCCC